MKNEKHTDIVSLAALLSNSQLSTVHITLS